MCGILGWFGPVKEDNFVNALNTMMHRGPDDGAVLSPEPEVHLGHRRLSIIDLSQHARQPMSTGDGRYTIVFNGEIYNFRDIRAELEKAGHIFRTQSDTEVLLTAYQAWQANCLNKLVGMFAFAVHDRKDNSVFLARDRFGIKPLYVTQQGDQFGFASEPKALLALMPESAKMLNHSAVFSYLAFRYPVTGDSFFVGIDSLKPGHWLKYDAKGHSEIHRYYRLADYVALEPPQYSMDEAAAELKQRLGEAVACRMVADVPVGAYLSGGVDSSAVVALMRPLKQALHTFSIGFDTPGFNELEYAEQVAQLFDTQHHSLTLSTQDYLDQWQRVIAFKDAPLGVPNEVPLYVMSKHLKQFITVVLSGEGADEVFAGYGRLFRSADDWEKLAQAANTGSGELMTHLAKRYGKQHFSDRLAHFLWLYAYQPLDQVATLFAEQGEAAQSLLDITALFRETFDELPQGSYLKRMQYVFQTLHLPGLLQRLDTTTMGASVEGRVPFVDHRVVEWGFSLPDDLKLAWQSHDAERRARTMTGNQVSEQLDIPKAVLKAAFRTLLPDNILDRKKMGFPVPLADVMPLLVERKAVIGGDRALVDSQLFNQGALTSALENATQNPMLAWQCQNLEYFIGGMR